MNSLNYQKIFRGLTAIGILITILMPHLLFELTVEFLHLLLEWLIELGDILFEWVELSLDTVIELLFETDLHDTQIIVFYIIMSALGFVVYRLSLFVPGILRRMRDRIIAFYLGKKNCLIRHWKSLTLLNKTKLVAMALGISYLYIFLSF